MHLYQSTVDLLQILWEKKTNTWKPNWEA